jgi:hypothetical protein
LGSEDKYKTIKTIKSIFWLNGMRYYSHKPFFHWKYNLLLILKKNIYYFDYILYYKLIKDYNKYWGNIMDYVPIIAIIIVGMIIVTLVGEILGRSIE